MCLIRISGAASDSTGQLPTGAAAGVHPKGCILMFVLHDQQFSNMGDDLQLHSAVTRGATHDGATCDGTSYEVSTPCDDTAVSASARPATITTAGERIKD
jgi:hypothetical protein